MPILKKAPYVFKPVAKHTFGHSVPKNGKRACYDPKTNTYTRAACGKDVLLSQGVGVIQGLPDNAGIVQDSWNLGFSGGAFGGTI